MSNTSTVKTLPLVPFKEMPYTRPDMKAIEKGFADGSYQTKLETAKLMRMHNYPIAEICTMTGLSKEEVEALN